MNAIQQLEDALQERNTKTNEFLEEIIAIINQSVANLPTCTPSNSTPEVAGSVKMLRKNLDEIIGKIKDDGNINKHAAENLVSRLKFSNVKKSDSRESIRSSQSLSGFSDRSLTPRSSELEGLRFSADRNSQAKLAYPILQPNDGDEFDFDKPPRYEPSNPNGGKRRTRRR